MTDNTQCGKPAYYKYKWGYQSFIVCCKEHGELSYKLANYIGYNLPIIKINEEGLKCKHPRDLPVSEVTSDKT